MSVKLPGKLLYFGWGFLRKSVFKICQGNLLSIRNQMIEDEKKKI
jgi:hypothetical protein